MNNNDLFDRRRIYINYSSQISSKSGNEWIFIYKLILILFFAIGSLVLFIKLGDSLFPEKVLVFLGGKPFQNFISFVTVNQQQINATLLIRFSILYFVFLFATFKNFSNINEQKERIKQYIVFYILYLSLSIIAFVLFFAFIGKNIPIKIKEGNVEKIVMVFVQHKYINLVYLLIPLTLVNISFEIYKFILKRKSDPIIYKSLLPIIIQTFSQLMLLGFVLFNVLLWDSYSKNGSLFDGENQKYWNFVERLFNEKNSKNLLIIVSIFTFIIFMIIGSNAMKLHKISEKNIYQVQEKDRYILGIIFIVVAIIWLGTLLGGQTVKYAIFGKETKYDLIHGLVIIIASITTFLYFAFSFISKTNTKNPIALSVRFAIAQLLIWVPLVYSVITYDNSNINLINLFILTSLSSATFIHYLIKNKSFSNLTTFFIIVLFIVKISLLLIFGLNHILLTQENHVLVSVPTPISIVKIISISYVSVLIFFVVCLVIHLQSAIGVKIFKKKKVIN
ncbi:MSC_0624 family F1-like ATPase-associated membrane protein [Mycoplasmopsis cynos]|uniref:Uncharacterized protein n=3 Tax=Mycoplasmopsis cynos TaxID=171284 RepID=A0ABD8AIJ5_9BACT|nr:hypothetical protein [Mycoplasmopsis cynos]MCU9935386.1 hypothetical protein [Mycoplasmopsis cynos]UWV86460.1 hypothetical protein NW063_01865 [Mycoplasmopsis cynos]WQQ19796.1 hypothetical protein RRG46_03025 [Mycoplasmopsis cynos]